MVQLTPLAVCEVAGFDSEEQRRQQVAVRRETVFGPWAGGLGKFGVVFDSSGAEEECVSTVAVVKEEQLFVVGSHPAQRNFSRWGLVETPAGVLCKLAHTYMYTSKAHKNGQLE